MLTSQTSTLCEPAGNDPIPLWTLVYFRERNRDRLYELVLREFQRSELSQADLARRLGKDRAVISRLLGSPGNWGSDTASDLLFAISGAEPHYTLAYPLQAPALNDTMPAWLQPAQITKVENTTSGSVVVSGNVPLRLHDAATGR